MRTYLIGYDLNKTGKNYEQLIENIKSLSGTWWHHLDSTWVIKHNGSASEIRDKLKPFIDGDDELFVVRIMTESAWVGFNEQGKKWLMDNVTTD